MSARQRFATTDCLTHGAASWSLCRNERLNAADIRRGTRHVEVVHPLEIQPEVRRHVECPADTQSRIRRNGASAVHDLVDAYRRHAYRLRQTILANTEFIENLCQVFSRMDWSGS